MIDMESFIKDIDIQKIKEYLSTNILFDKFFIFDCYSEKSGSYNILKETDFPVRIDLFIAILCEDGFMNMEIGYNNYTVQKNDFILLSYQRIFHVINVSENFRAKVLCLEENFFQVDNSFNNVRIDQLLRAYPHQSLPAPKMKLFTSVFDYLISVIRDESNIYRKQIVFSGLNVLFFELCNFLIKKKDIFQQLTHHEEIFKKFIQNIEANFRKERSIIFYANKASLTPKYFSSIIFKLTGKHAKDWINEYTIMEAKAMLKSTRLTIQEISHKLNFATPSHFGLFFKHHTGISPLQYRNS